METTEVENANVACRRHGAVLPADEGVERHERPAEGKWRYIFSLSALERWNKLV